MVPEEVHSELWTRKIARASQNVTTAIFIANGNKFSHTQPMGSFISTTQGDHCPTPDDVFAVRRFLLAFVPVELANLILNEANYWPKATWSFEPENPLIVFASDNRWSDAASCCLLTPKLCDLLYGGKVERYKIKTICFKTMSHDQGWCSNGDFSGIM